MIVGGGEDLERLKAQSEASGLSNVTRFIGRVAPAEVAQYYYLSDVTVDPVDDDDAARGRSPLKLFEGWATGIPVVTSDVGDRASLLGSAPAGLLSYPGDPASLAEKILEILQNPTLSSQISQLGRERAKLYSWDRLVINLEELYFRLLEHNG